MGLFIVRHEHGGERCPAGDPALGALLLNQLSRPSARSYGVEIKGEAVVEGDHVMYMILEAGSDEEVRRFVQPFAEAGTVEVYPASTCVRAVASGGVWRLLPTSGSASLSIRRRRASRRSTPGCWSIGPIRSTGRPRSPPCSAAW